MSDILAFFTFRTVILLFSSTFSILAMMVMLNIVTVNDISVILKLSPEATSALKLIVDRLNEVTSNVLDILSQLLNKLFDWAGVHIDLSKIGHHGDVANPSTVPAGADSATGAGSTSTSGAGAAVGPTNAVHYYKAGK